MGASELGGKNYWLGRLRPVARYTGEGPPSNCWWPPFPVLNKSRRQVFNIATKADSSVLNDLGQTWRRRALDCSFASMIFFTRSFAVRAVTQMLPKPYAGEETSQGPSNPLTLLKDWLAHQDPDLGPDD